MTIPESSSIRFGKEFPPLEYYDNQYWEILEHHKVEFFKDSWYDVILISTEIPNFIDYLPDNLQEPISLDLEWESELCLFQFCFHHTVIILRHPNGEGNQQLLHFLLTHKFYAKGTHNDKKQLEKKFNTSDIAKNIEDIAKTRLASYNYSENFMTMVHQFRGNPTAEFKDIKITTSNWELPKLTKRQILYAAFDVVSLKECYPNYPPAKIIEKVKESQPKDSTKKLKSPASKIKFKDMKNLNSNEYIKQHIKLKRSPAREITGFIIEGYTGPRNLTTIRNIFNDEIIDFCSTFENYLFIGFLCTHQEYNEADILNKLNQYGTKIIKKTSSITESLHVTSDESTDGDVLFVQNISKQFESKFNDFLYCFGNNHDVTFHNNENPSLNYIRIESREASSSYRTKMFLNGFEYDNERAVVTEFPSFLPIIRINDVPDFFTKENLQNLFESAGKIDHIEILRRRDKNDKQTAFVTFQTTEEAENAVKKFNHMMIGKPSENHHYDSSENILTFLNSNISSISSLTNELKVFRYTDEPHLRFMRSYELKDTRVKMFNYDSKLLESHYNQYGPILYCYYDPFFNVGHIQFYHKKDAIIASTKENSEMIEESRTIVIRDLSFKTTDSDILRLCSSFGTIVNLITRDINNIMRFIIKEVTFSSIQETNKAKAALSTTKMIHGCAIRVAILNGGYSDAPDWKMRQRKHWVKFILQKPDDAFFDKVSQAGHILKMEFKSLPNTVYIPEVKENQLIPVLIPQTTMQDVTFVMFQQFESAQQFSDPPNYPTIDEFVNELNPRELYIETEIVKIEKHDDQTVPLTSKESLKITDRKPIKMAIVIDPIPEFVTKELLDDFLIKHEVNCEVFVDESFANPNELNPENTSSLKEQKRAVLVAASKTLTNKIYTIINENQIIDEDDNATYLKPIRMRYDDVPNKPSLKPKEKVVVHQELRKMTIVIDPLPIGMNEEDIENICGNFGKYNLRINPSAKLHGRNRALIHPLCSRAKKHIFRALSTAINGEELAPTRIFPQDIPPSLEDN